MAVAMCWHGCNQFWASFTFFFTYLLVAVAIRFASPRFASLRLVSPRFDSLCLDSARFGSILIASPRFASLRLADGYSQVSAWLQPVSGMDVAMCWHGCSQFRASFTFLLTYLLMAVAIRFASPRFASLRIASPR
jgi:hypothetical protein